MTAITNAEFAKRMLLLAGEHEQFRPTATFDPDGDCIEFLAKPDSFYAERVDDLLTAYYSQETGELIGSLVKGVSTLCADLSERLPGLKIEIHDGHVRLVHIFRARAWTLPPQVDEMTTLIYRKLIDVAEMADVAVAGDLCLA